MRKELKYYINHQKALLLYQMLSCVCTPDEHQAVYTIKSLYFDDVNNTSLHEKLSGVDRLGKVRIRIYNEDYGHIKLEYKHKKGDWVNKMSIPISETDMDAILKNPSLVSTYFHHVVGTILKPKEIIKYRRKALVYTMSDIRFTFDDQLFISSGHHVHLKSDTLYGAVLPDDIVIFEVKYSYELPTHLTHILSDLGIQTAISKYTISRTSI